MSKLQRALDTVVDIAQSEQFEQFRINAEDFLSARERGESAGTRIDQMSAALDDAAEVVNRSFPERQPSGQFTNVISPVVIPRDRRSYRWVFWTTVLIVIGLIGRGVLGAVDTAGFTNAGQTFFGPHYWLLVLIYAVYSAWKNSFAMIPDGCQALITKFGKLETIAPAGRVWLLNPWKRVSYIVNTTKEYPYNAPIREAPTAERVNASVDLFLQFKIEDPAEFIFALGGVRGFAEKLQNAISEVTRALIYEQRAQNIYDLVGENTQNVLATLNQQFLPAVRFTNANITHAEPSSQEYRMDLAAPEMVRVAKEAYTYQYQLKLRKEQDEGDLNRELAALRETLSAIRAEIATFQAQIDVAREKETHRANAYARQLMIEAESAAKANAALLEAQALDIRAASSASYPEILQYRYQQRILDRLESIAGNLPQVVHIGAQADEQIDFTALARHLLGTSDESVYSEHDLEAIRQQMPDIRARIQQRAAQLQKVLAEAQAAARAAQATQADGGTA